MLGSNVNVDTIIEPAAIGSENVMVIGFVRDAWVVPVEGTVETTVGRVRSKTVVPGPRPFSRASHERTARTIRARRAIGRNGADIGDASGRVGQTNSARDAPVGPK